MDLGWRETDAERWMDGIYENAVLGEEEEERK
jgi:hypothetical protein